MRKSFQIKYLDRPNESQILGRALSISNTIALTGLEGAGKTSLVREFLSEQQSSVKWYTLSNFLTLSALLGFPELDPEQAINEMLNSLKISTEEVYVWDNLHFLNFQNQQKLIYSLLNSGQMKTHIFISDEKIELPSEIPLINLGGLSIAEVPKFLELFNTPLNEITADQIFSLTGGLPLLLKQWILNPNNNSLEKNILKNITENQSKLLKILSISKVELKQENIDKLDLENIDILLAELQKKNYLEISTNNHILVPLFIKKSVTSYLQKNEALVLSKSLLKLLINEKSMDQVPMLITSLEAHEHSLAIKYANHIEPEDLEQLTSENLNLIVSSIQAYSEIDFTKNENVKLARILIHSLVISNKRAEAIETANQIIQKLDWNEEFITEKQWLAYDLIYWLDRSKHSSLTQKYISLFINRSKAPFNFLFQIELNFVLTQSTDGAQAARNNLKRLLMEVTKNNTDSQVSKIALANCHYQLGINYMITSESKLAVNHFSEAKNLFHELRRTYFELFCEFNTCLLLFDQNELSDIQNKLSNLKKKAVMNGYLYLLAGTDLLSARIAYHNLESSRALSLIEDSYSRIDTGMPLNSKVDILGAKIRILTDLGLENSAQKVYEELGKIISNTNVSELKRLAIETQIDFHPIAEAEDVWKSFDKNLEGSDALQIYLLQRGINRSNNHQGQSLRYQIALAENEIISALRISNLPLVEDAIRNAENLLKRTSEDRIERIAIWCLSASLNPEKAEMLIEKAKLYLQKISITNSARLYFLLWITSIEQRKSIKEFKEFANCHTQEIERWGLWLVPEKKKKYTLYQINSIAEVSDLLPTPPKDGIYIIDNQKEVFVKGKKTTAFEKKPILIQILVLLISHFPEKLSKATLASTLWGESYDPSIHDARIYTSIQRIRAILGEKHIENWEGGYRWSNKLPFYLFRSNETQGLKQNKIATVFIETLRKRKQNQANEGFQWMSRKDLVEAGDTSDATAKRVLAELLKDNVIEKQGNGPSTAYRLVR